MSAASLQRATVILFAAITAAVACWVMASLIDVRESPAVLNDIFRLLDDETRRTIVGAVTAIVAVIPAWMGRVCYQPREAIGGTGSPLAFSWTGIVVMSIFVLGAILGLVGYVTINVPKWEPLSTLGPKGLEILKDGSRHSFLTAILYITFFLGVKKWPA